MSLPEAKLSGEDSELLRIPDSEPSPEELIRKLAGVEEGEIVRVYTKKAGPHVFNNPDVVDAFREAKVRGAASIRVITSSIVVTDGDGRNGLLDLHDEELNGVPVVDQLNHSLVVGVDDEFYGVENPNGETLPAEDKTRRLAQADIVFFDNLATLLQGTTDPEAQLLPLRITEANFREFMDRVVNSGISIYSVKPRRLLDLPAAQGLFLT